MWVGVAVLAGRGIASRESGGWRGASGLADRAMRKVDYATKHEGCYTYLTSGSYAVVRPDGINTAIPWQ